MDLAQSVLPGANWGFLVTFFLKGNSQKEKALLQPWMHHFGTESSSNNLCQPKRVSAEDSDGSGVGCFV